MGRLPGHANELRCVRCLSPLLPPPSLFLTLRSPPPRLTRLSWDGVRPTLCPTVRLRLPSAAQRRRRRALPTGRRLADEGGMGSWTGVRLLAPSADLESAARLGRVRGTSSNFFAVYQLCAGPDSPSGVLRRSSPARTRRGWDEECTTMLWEGCEGVSLGVSLIDVFS